MAKSSSVIPPPPSPGSICSARRVKRFYVICDHLISDDPCTYTCIILDKGSGGEKTRFTISPHPNNTVKPLPILSRFTSVALGSNIYMIGGFCHFGFCPDGCRYYYHSHPNVRVFNALRPGDGWKELAPMHLPRIRPAAVVVDGKIYVFGGLEGDDPEDGEYYDPATNQWHRFHAPGCRTTFPLVESLYVDPEGARSILVYTDCANKLVSYPLDTHTPMWKIVSQEFGNCHRPTAILDHVIYAFLCNDFRTFAKVRLHGYDLINKRWVLVAGLDDDVVGICCHTAWVIVSGVDRLCLMWFDNVDDVARNRIQCLELKIEKSFSEDNTTGSGGGGVMLNLTATTLSKTYFPVEKFSCLETILTL